VEFKLYTLEQTSIECKYEGGEVTYISVLPDERYDDIEVMNGASLPANYVIKQAKTVNSFSDAAISFTRNLGISRIQITPETNAEWYVQLVDPKGRQLMKSIPRHGGAVIEAGKLPAGMYFCILHTGKTSVVKQLLISEK
jgi:hypothetical protein